MINYETYVSLEVAKLLKEAGFDWGCPTAWDLTFPNEPYLNYDAIYPVDFRNNLDDVFYAPTLSVAQKWLREKNLLLYICPLHINKKWLWRYWFINCIDKEDTTQVYSSEEYNTYEEAQEAGIKRCLEIILEKGE